MERALGALLRAILALPRPVLRRLAGPERVNDRGAVLDLDLQVMLRLSELLGFPTTYEQTPEEARAGTESKARIVEPSPPPVARREDHRIEGPRGPIRLVSYRPRTTDGPLPVLVYLHGGGYAVGSTASADGVCRTLCLAADCVVVSVDYRLAPEDPFPAGLEDCLAAFDHVASHAASFGGAPSRVAIGGDSAGGTFATVVCRERRDADLSPYAQLLIYPATDLTRSLPSHERFGTGFYLEDQTMDWFTGHYIGERDDLDRDPRVSPLFADDLTGLPPAFVVTAGFDPLRDEGEAYVERLRDAGVRVEHQHEPSLVHGFVNMPVSRAAAVARSRMAGRFGAMLRQG